MLIKIFFVGYPVIFVLEVMKTQTAAKSALDLPRIKVGVPYTFKHHINQYILSTWSGAVVNKLHSVKPVWGIGSPTGSAGRMKLSCVMHTLVMLI